jgi:hypothetical protein
MLDSGTERRSRSKARWTTSFADFARSGSRMSERKGSSNGWRDWDNAALCGVGRRERGIRPHASFQLFKPPRHYFNSARSAWRFLSGSRANPPATTPPFRISGSTESGQRLADDPIFPIRAALPRSATFVTWCSSGILVRRLPRLHLGEQTGVRFRTHDR